MVHTVPPDWIGGRGQGRGGPRLDQNKGTGSIPKTAGRCQHQQPQQQHQDDGYKAAAAAAIADMKKVLKNARLNRRLNPGMMLTPAPTTNKTPGAAAVAASPPVGGWSAPNYMRATSSSDARMGRQQQQQQQQKVSKAQPLFATPAGKRHSITTPKPPSCNSKTHPPPTSTTGGSSSTTRSKTPKKTLLLSRKPSLKLVIPATSTTTTLVTAAPLFENISVSKATCSSTLKDSKFPDELQLHPGGTQLDGTSVVKVCPYTYCSLNGHLHAPAVPLRRFLSAKRRMIKAHKGVKIRGLPSPPRKRVLVMNADADGIEEQEQEIETSPHSTVLDERNEDYFLHIYVNTNGSADNGDSASEGGLRNPDAEVNNHEDDDDDDDDAQSHVASEPEQAPGISQQLDIDLDLIPDDGTSYYADMNLVDDIIDRLSDISISISGTEFTARSPEHVECLDHKGTTAAADNMEECRQQKKSDDDDGSAMFDWRDFVQQLPAEEDPLSLTPSEAVEVDCQEEMPEYAAEEEEHDQGAAETNQEEMPEYAVEKEEHDQGAAQTNQEEMPEYAAEEEEHDQGATETNQEEMPEYAAEEEDHDQGATETNQEVREIMGDEEEAVTATTVPQSDSGSVHDEYTGQDEQLLPEMDGESRTRFGISRSGSKEALDQLGEFNPRGPNFLPVQPVPEADKVDLRHWMADERKNAGDGGSEATVEDNMVAGDEHSDVDNKVPTKDDNTAHVAEDAILETSLSCPKGKPAIRRPAAKPLPEMDSESRIQIIISRASHGEDVDELKEFNPRGPNFLPLQPDPEAEKVDLRHQMMDDRKNAEDWMIDHALQLAVNKLAPARKKKVALLVEAFETVAPSLPLHKANPLRHTSLRFAHSRPMQACS